METVWLSIGIAVGIMLIGLMVFHLMTPQLLMLFQADEEMLAIGVPALRIISLSSCSQDTASSWDPCSRPWATAYTA